MGRKKSATSRFELLCHFAPPHSGGWTRGISRHELPRGLKRLFLVLAICYYLICGLLVYADWTVRTSTRRFELSRCLEATVAKRYYDVNGNPIVLDPSPAQLPESPKKAATKHIAR